MITGNKKTNLKQLIITPSPKQQYKQKRKTPNPSLPVILASTE